MSARVIETRLSDLKIARLSLEMCDPNAAMGHTGRRLSREIDRLNDELQAVRQVAA